MKFHPLVLMFLLVIVMCGVILHLYYHHYALAMLTILPVIPALMNKKLWENLTSR